MRYYSSRWSIRRSWLSLPLGFATILTIIQSSSFPLTFSKPLIPFLHCAGSSFAAVDITEHPTSGERRFLLFPSLVWVLCNPSLVTAWVLCNPHSFTWGLCNLSYVIWALALCRLLIIHYLGTMQNPLFFICVSSIVFFSDHRFGG